MNILDSLSTGFKQFQARLKNEPRLALLMVGAFVVLWVLFLIELMDWSDRLTAKLEDNQRHLLELRSLSSEDSWPERLKETQETLKNLESMLWPIQPEGLAMATFQDYLARKADKNGLEQARIKVKKPLVDKALPGYMKITAEITAPFSPDSVQQFLASMMTADRLISIESFDLKHQPQGPFTANISVFMPYKGSTEKGERKVALR